MPSPPPLTNPWVTTNPWGLIPWASSTCPIFSLLACPMSSPYRKMPLPQPRPGSVLYQRPSPPLRPWRIPNGNPLLQSVLSPSRPRIRKPSLRISPLHPNLHPAHPSQTRDTLSPMRHSFKDRRQRPIPHQPIPSIASIPTPLQSIH